MPPRSLISSQTSTEIIIRVSQATLQEAVTKHGEAFKEMSEKVKEFEKALKKVTSSIRDNCGYYEKLASLLEQN